jgi:hypothetical protein
MSGTSDNGRRRLTNGGRRFARRRSISCPHPFCQGYFGGSVPTVVRFRLDLLRSRSSPEARHRRWFEFSQQGEKAGADEATRHLIGLGHKEIGLMSVRSDSHPIVHDARPASPARCTTLAYRTPGFGCSATGRLSPAMTSAANSWQAPTPAERIIRSQRGDRGRMLARAAGGELGDPAGPRHCHDRRFAFGYIRAPGPHRRCRRHVPCRPAGHGNPAGLY